MPEHDGTRRPRILYVGIDFYDYPREIAAAFGRAGFGVDFWPIQPTSFWQKTFKKFLPRLFRQRLDAYHRRIVTASKATHYDVVFFLQVHHVAHDVLETLRADHPQARFVLYNWDSLTTHDFRPWLHHFDAAATFDVDDARALGISYLPLFAVPAFFAIDRAVPKDFDLYFVGAIVTLARFDAIARLQAFCRDHGVRLKTHLRCSPAIRLLISCKRRPIPGLTLAPLDFSAIVDLMSRSRGVFDFANHRQSGYTMRFMENMCAGQKIVTENSRVLDEEFYRPDRFLVVRDLDFTAVPAFLDLPVTSTLDVERFSVDSWARRLIDVP